VSKTTYEELEQERDESVAHCELLKSVISPSAIDYIKCGIAVNYGGIYFDEKLEQIYAPVVRALKQTPQQSLLFHDANVIERACAKLVPWNESGIISKDQLLEMVDQLREQAKEGVK
jgi:hypothetical protein